MNVDVSERAFEDAEPFALQRVDKDGAAGKATLKADKEKGTIVLDGQTTLNRVPAEAWEYRLGSRSALEWVLDQYKEKTPRDPTIRERFNTYRFADHKERVVDLLQRVCTVSVETVRIVNQLNLQTSIEPENNEESIEEAIARLAWWIDNEGIFAVDERGERVRYDEV